VYQELTKAIPRPRWWEKRFSRNSQYTAVFTVQ